MMNPVTGLPRQKSRIYIYMKNNSLHICSLKRTFVLFILNFSHVDVKAGFFSKKECALAHSRAEARLLRQPSTFAPSAHPRGAFLYDRTQFPII